MWRPASLLMVLVALVGAAGGGLRIAAVFDEADPPHLRSAYLAAVEAVNLQTAGYRVRASGFSRPVLAPLNVTVPRHDGFRTARIEDKEGEVLSAVCRLMEQGVAGIIGPSQSASTDIVRSICDRLHVPQLVLNWDPSPPTAASYQLNLHPESHLLSQALVDVLRELKWRSYTVLYQDEESLVRLRSVLQEREPRDPPIAVRQLNPDGDHRSLLKEIRQAGETRLVLDVDTELIPEVLWQANEVNLMGLYQSFFITSLNALTLDLSRLRGSGAGANFTLLRMVQRERLLHDFPAELRSSRTTGEALMQDAVDVLSEALFHQDTERPLHAERLKCDGPAWMRGQGVRQALHDIQHEGISGSIAFDDLGRRVGFSLEVLQLSAAGFRRVGTWTPAQGFSSTRTNEEDMEDTRSILQGRHLIVSSRIGAPYLMMKKPTTPPRVGNDRYEGYSMDLITKIAEQLHFTFEFQLAKDGEYGSLNEKTGAWDGLVGDLLAGRAELAICDLTITELRQSVVDFTMPFMNLGISILYKKAEKMERSLFSFMDPFTVDVWIFVATAFLGVSLIFYIVARAAPMEWQKANPRDPNCNELENQFSMSNILWFTGSALLGGGGEEMPKAVSTRIMAGMWAFFKLIMLASYTANLAAFLTSSRMESSINSVNDLAKQSKIKYGLYGSGSTAGFFKNSNDSLYQRMWTIMKQARPNVFTNGNDEGVERVRKEKGKYAFFMESTSIEYITALDCNLRKVGGLLDSKGYGIALPRDSPYRTAISGAVLTLQERGNLTALKELWWKAPEGKECPAEEEGPSSSNAELGILDVGGVFLVLGCGMILAMIINVLEFLWNCRTIAVEEQISHWDAFVSELKLVSRLCSDVKPVRKSHLPQLEGPQPPDVCG
ncbi:glutamate receptor ionotropic, kainate 2-like [Schistocerca piceifrons]|uniref:glutamate receptor ionotropic, kainate 2-like n=1 Tax=Schistocerca piceifrons TaxID=274613 RepID=UPI001F5FAF05|nr:glutamate receptor ionotropic, kainate 2-like [Schistocerca piceifrons]